MEGKYQTTFFENAIFFGGSEDVSNKNMICSKIGQLSRV